MPFLSILLKLYCLLPAALLLPAACLPAVAVPALKLTPLKLQGVTRPGCDDTSAPSGFTFARQLLDALLLVMVAASAPAAAAAVAATPGVTADET